MRIVGSPRSTALSLALLVLPLPLGCGDDGGTDTGAATSPVTSTSDGSTSTGEASTSTTVDASTGSTGSVDGTSTTAAESSTGLATDDGPTGGDPAYPIPDAGGCPDGTLEVSLPGANICAPFCGGPDDACPAAATGDATPQCIPFAGPGGSGDACDDVTQCPDGETCNDGACSEIAFFACQLVCDMGQTCPDDMACSGIATCGYP